jgi:hypothetical protein
MNWPTKLPNPTVSFSGSNRGQTVSTQMQSGRIRSRRKTTREFQEWNVTWEFSDFQLGLFKSFFSYKLNGGADFFLMSAPTGGTGMETAQCRFKDGKYSISHYGILRWKVSAVLEVEDVPIWTEEQYGILSETDDLVTLEYASARTSYVNTLV